MNRVSFCLSKCLIVVVLLWTTACSNSDSFIGHWRCDKTGSVTIEAGSEREHTESIGKFYDGFEMPPLEIEFLDNDTCVFYHVKSTMITEGNRVVKFSDNKHTYIKDYNGDKSKVMILTNDGKDENLMTILEITNDKMRVSLESEDDMTFDITMNRLNK